MSLKICCVTGHRNIPDCKLEEVKTMLDKEVQQALTDGFRMFISGFAEGTDLLFAEIVVKYKAEYPDIFLEAAIPHPDRVKSKNEQLQHLLTQCNGIHVVSEQYHPQCFEKRNRYMVQDSHRVIAVYDGRESGGTLFTMRYAHCLEKEVRLIRI